MTVKNRAVPRETVGHWPKALHIPVEVEHLSDIYRGADKSLPRPTSRCILFDGENISFDASIVTYGVPLATEPGHFFNNSNTNEDIATKFEQEYVRCVRNEKECVCSAPNCCDMEQRSASQPGSVASGTHCILVFM